MKLHTFRLKPGQDIKAELENYARGHDMQAGFIVTCVAGLKGAKLRMAGAAPDKQDIRSYSGHFEVVSLSGTVSANGCHLHMSISDQEGKVIGGHLKEATVYPTAEIVLGEDETTIFNREPDPETGFDELVIKPANHH